MLQTVHLETGKPGVIPLSSIADAHYVHEQTVASATWAVTHNLGKKPSVIVVDSGNNTIEPDIVYIDNNSLEIHFAGSTSGFAYSN
jgi:hypothetical protein